MTKTLPVRRASTFGYKRRAASFKRAMVEEFSRSSFTITEFCKEKEIPLSSFSKWHKECANSLLSKPSVSPPKFVSVKYRFFNYL